MSESPTYIDYESFLDPDFSATSFANNLILTTNNPSDTPLDLTTPLSRVLFDIQEIDTHIHNLTSQTALPLLTHTKEKSEASQRILTEVGGQLDHLRDGYGMLEKEVVDRWEVADQVRLVTERLWRTVRLGRALGRCLSLGRQLEVQIAELGAASESATTAGGRRLEDHRAMVRAANTLLALRQMFSGEEGGDGLERIRVAVTLREDLMKPVERYLVTKAQQIIREFSMLPSSSSSSLTSSSSSNISTNTTTTYNQTEEIKSRTTSALLTLHLLSPTTLLSTLQSHLQTALTSSLASLTRTLTSITTITTAATSNTTITTLDRTLHEISSRCQTIVALEALLDSIKPPDQEQEQTLLQPLLKALDTTSLPSHFWRALAGGLSSRTTTAAVGGSSSNDGGGGLSRERIARVRELVRECVIRGFATTSTTTTTPGLSSSDGTRGKDGASAGGGSKVSREREVAVMVGAVLGVLTAGGR